jgi:ATP-binding cassette subfamily B protein
MSDALGALRQSVTIVRHGVREQRGMFLLAVLGSTLYGTMTAASAWVIGRVTDRYVAPAVTAGSVDAATLVRAGGSVALVVVLTTAGVLVRRIAGGVTMFNVGAVYRRRVTRQYLRLPLSWHHRHPSGLLLSNANADVEATWNVFAPLPMALGVLVMLVVGTVQMVLVDPVMALVGVAVFPGLMLANAVFQRKMSPRVTRAQQLRADVSDVAHESFEAALLVKAMGREEAETDRFTAVSHELRDANIAVGRTRGTFDPVIEAIPTLGTLAVIGLGTQRVASGSVTPAEVVQIAYLISVLAFPVRALGWVLGELPRTIVGWTRISAVLGAEGAVEYGDAGIERLGTATDGDRRGSEVGARYEAARLDLDDVTYAYESTEPTAGDVLTGGRGQVGPGRLDGATRVRALDGVDLDVAPGRTVAVVGPTGSGKTTLAALSTRLVDPTSGRVRINDVDLATVRHGGVAAVAALVPQATFMFDDTVRENVTLGSPYGDHEVWRALGLAQAEGFVRALPDGLDTRVGERGTSLSGGQRQRIALARALVRRPRLLLLDDATSSVDATVEQAILAGLRADATGTTLVVAYRMSTIALADDVVYVEAGRVVDRGPHLDLLARCPAYARLVTAYAEEAAERARARSVADRGAAGDSTAEGGRANGGPGGMAR